MTTKGSGIRTALAVRQAGAGDSDPPTWFIRSCPFCRRTHRHTADPVATRLVIPAACSKIRFYEVRECE